MLDFVRPTGPAGPSDLVWAFQGRNLIGELMGEQGAPIPLAQLESDFDRVSGLTPVGFLNKRPVYACSVETSAMDMMKYASGNLFALLSRLSATSFDIVGRAYQLLTWDREHAYCGRCGGATTLADKGQSRYCNACNLSVYPRLSPCVIMLVTRDEECLLAAGAGANRRFYSCLAGFVEPGESCEQAVQREVMEEVGLTVDNIRYHGSQPWPFPGQLMLGFTARWTGGEINIDPEEIDEALWCKPDNLPPIPPAFSIAGQLINSFLSSQT